MAALIIVAIVIAVAGGLVLAIAVPVRYVDGVVCGLSWQRTMRVGQPVLEKRYSLRPTLWPGMTNVRAIGKRGAAYAYEGQAWRQLRTVTASGDDRDDAAWPSAALRPGEQVRDKSGSYTVELSSAKGKRRRVKVPERQWRSLEMGGAYRFGRNIVGYAVRVRPASQ